MQIDEFENTGLPHAQAKSAPEMDLQIFDLFPVDIYLHSLLHHEKIWNLTDTNIIAMCDYIENEGNIEYTLFSELLCFEFHIYLY